MAVPKVVSIFFQLSQFFDKSSQPFRLMQLSFHDLLNFRNIPNFAVQLKKVNLKLQRKIAFKRSLTIIKQLLWNRWSKWSIWNRLFRIRLKRKSQHTHLWVIDWKVWFSNVPTLIQENQLEFRIVRSRLHLLGAMSSKEPIIHGINLIQMNFLHYCHQSISNHSNKKCHQTQINDAKTFKFKAIPNSMTNRKQLVVSVCDIFFEPNKRSIHLLNRSHFL